MAKQPEFRTELDDRLRDQGINTGMFPSEEAKERARWSEKQWRDGKVRKTVRDPRK